jgi:hypothetical protein
MFHEYSGLIEYLICAFLFSKNNMLTASIQLYIFKIDLQLTFVIISLFDQKVGKKKKKKEKRKSEYIFFKKKGLKQ